jgi:PAS domain S-box-containing protein
MSKSLRILVIDDNPDDRALVVRELRREFQSLLVHEVSNAQGLEAALQAGFDLVVTDYQLCWTDGLRVLRQVKRLYPACPVIMFTGTGSEEVAVEAMKAGLEDYVLKSPKHYVRLASAIRSVVERAESKARAAELESRLQGLLDRLNVGIFRATVDGQIIEANPALLKLMGWTELPPETFLRELYYSPELQVQHLHELKQFGELRDFQVQLCPADGKPIMASMSQTLAAGPDGEQMVEGLVEDISERMRFEEQLRQSQKMESIGRLAAGVAHDFNNILTIIQGYASLLAEKDFDADTIFSLKNIGAAADRAATLTRQLLAFSRKQALHLEVLDLNQLVHSFGNVLRHVLGEHISLEISSDSHLPPLRGDAGAMEQILINLAINARDAMSSGGTLTINTAPVEVDKTYVRLHREARVGSFVCWTISDTGCGIEPENAHHVFEPFFTTKEVGKGTGLGLAAVYGIVKQHKGWIDLSSQPGRGTTFKIYLPAELHVVQPMPLPAAGMRKGSETVLVVEDEPELLDLVGEVLLAYGYQVIPATSAKKAMEVWKHSREKIDLLVTDMQMPDGIGGLDLARALTADNPRLKVLYTSGYCPDQIAPKVNLREGQNFLQKPYPPERLLSAIRNCLES